MKSDDRYDNLTQTQKDRSDKATALFDGWVDAGGGVDSQGRTQAQYAEEYWQRERTHQSINFKKHLKRDTAVEAAEDETLNAD